MNSGNYAAVVNGDGTVGLRGRVSYITVARTGTGVYTVAVDERKRRNWFMVTVLLPSGANPGIGDFDHQYDAATGVVTLRFYAADGTTAKDTAFAFDGYPVELE